MAKPGSRRSFWWPLLIFLWVAALALGVWGFSLHGVGQNLASTFWDNLYRTLQLITMNSGAVDPPVPWQLDTARFIVPALTLTTAIQALIGLFHNQARLLALRIRRGHVIICGLSRKGLLLVQQFRRQNRQVVVIDQDEENDWLETCHELGAAVLVGDATDALLLQRAGLERADALIAVCDNDGINAEIAVRAQDLSARRSGEPLTCLAHVTDPQLCTLLQWQQNGLSGTTYRLALFNVFQRGARLLLDAYPPWKPDFLKSNRVPHMLVVGLGRMGEALVVAAGRDWWIQQPNHTKKLHITIIDRYASAKTEALLVRCPQLAQACELAPLQMETRSAAFAAGKFLFNEAGQVHIQNAYVCFDDDSTGLHAGLNLESHLRGHSVPVVVRMAEAGGLSRLLEDRTSHVPGEKNLAPFNLLDRTCTPGLLTATPRDRLAQGAYEAYRRREAASGIKTVDSGRWDDLDAQARHDNFALADHLLQLLKEAGCTLQPLEDWDAHSFRFTADETERMARLEHQLWRTAKLADGYRYAPGTVDKEAKTHPDLVDWEKLPKKEKLKNFAIVQDLPILLYDAGYQVVRNIGAPAKEA